MDESKKGLLLLLNKEGDSNQVHPSICRF